jgi:hypothetical protein
MTPRVSTSTEMNCMTEYDFPFSQPAVMVVTLPKLRRMMWAGTLMLKAKAQLFSMLTAKNMEALVNRTRTGIAVFFRNNGGEEDDWDGYAEMATKMNCIRVIKSPALPSQLMRG